MIALAYCAVLGPLLGYVLAIPYYKRHNPVLSQFITCFLMAVAFGSAIALIVSNGFGRMETIHLFTWLKVESLRLHWGIQLDALSLTMMFVVNCVSFLVHLYSIGYMAHDENRAKFMAYLSLFTFAMLALVTAPNMVQLFFGWEGVGLASYLLIGFWYDRLAPPKAAMKAFIVNRVGDVGLVIAISLCFMIFGSLDFETIFLKLPEVIKELPTFQILGHEFATFEILGFCLLLGAMGKSAQFGLHTWLPDAMEGPTPVSALIHAATMVTAGVFLICRFSFVFEATYFARSALLIIGAVTAVFAASVAVTQTDIKRIIAYSTCSQLGYMMMACGASAYNAAMFHLVTHAFFKALLFLGAGSVIHAMSDEQNIMKMGGLMRLIPTTFAMMLIGSLALSGIPFFAGFFSKDAILESVYLAPQSFSFIVYCVGVIVAFLTAFYAWRLLILCFNGSPRGNEQVVAHVHESPRIMLLPLFVLSIGAVVSGYVGYQWYMQQSWSFAWGEALVFHELDHHKINWLIKYAPLVAAGCGIGLAYLLYFKDIFRAESLKKQLSVLHQFLFNKWYIDELYDVCIVKPLLKLGRIFWIWGDQKTLDRFGPDGIANLTLWTSQQTLRMHTGWLNTYAVWMAITVILSIVFYIGFFANDIHFLIGIKP